MAGGASTTFNLNYDYFLGNSPPTAATTANLDSAVPLVLTDDQDGTSDGCTGVGDGSLAHYNNLGVVEIYGYTAANEPIVFVAGNPTGAGYHLLSNNGSLNGTAIGPLTTTGIFVYCFAAGTLIDTPERPVRVDALQIGDRVRTADGAAAEVKWIGRQTVHKLFSGVRMQPVRFRAGALGDGVPRSDLTVTADHGMVIDGLVINAAALINGTTIDWVPMEELPDRVTYYHVETEHHDVILANGAPAETYVDIPGRMAFDNYQEYLDLYGAERIVPEMNRPRISSQRLLPETIRARLAIEDRVIDLEWPVTA